MDIEISIHSLLAEGDGSVTFLILVHHNFNPLPPRRGRHDGKDRLDQRGISIHSLLAEGDYIHIFNPP